MKKAEWKVGELVQVPYYCFAPHRYGWNGYLFADGEIIGRTVLNRPWSGSYSQRDKKSQ